jgi:hypothetical protein
VATLSKHTTRIFNLLKPYKAPPTSWDKIYDWLLGRARIVMIVAEIVVALSFAGKVIVDVQAKNLDDQIEVKDFELSQFANTIEPKLRTLQQKALTYTKVWEGSSRYAEILKEINGYIPNAGADLNIRINGNQVTIRGDDSLGTLSLIESAIRNSSTFSSVSVSSLSSDSGEVIQETGVLVLNATIADIDTRTKINP